MTPFRRRMPGRLSRGSAAGWLGLWALLASACAGESPVVVEGARGVLLMGNGAEPQDLDPHIVTGVTEHNIISALLEGLVSEHPKTLAPVPAVARAWTISADGKTYRFQLREDARWSNGDPVSADDFVFSWRRLLSPRLGAEYAYQLYPIVGAEAYHRGTLDDFGKVGVGALSAHALEVRLRYPVPYFLSLLSHFSAFPVHPPTIARFGEPDQRGSRWTRPGNYVGNGPFALRSWRLNHHIAVERNPHYWDAATVSLNGIRFLPIDQAQTAERMFRTGALHLGSGLPVDKISVYQRDYPQFIRITPYFGTYYYIFNTRREPFTDPRVRRALSMAINRRQLVERVVQGGQLPALAFTPPADGGFVPEAGITEDIAAARALLADAGYPQGNGFPAVELLYNTSENHRKIAVALQQMWRQALGISVVLSNQDWKVYLSSRRSGNFDIARAGWIGDYLDPNTFLDLMVSHSGNNHTGWGSPQYDALIAAAAETSDRAARDALFQRAERMLADASPVLPIYWYTNIALIRPEVRGWHANLLDRHPYKHVSLAPPAAPAR